MSVPLLLALFACSPDEPLDQPNTPPPPPAMYGVVEADVARYTGLATEIHGPTRSFVLTGEGKRVLAMLSETATLRIGGMPSQVQDLAAGTTLYVEGRRDGDTLLVLRATDTPDANDAAAAGLPVPAGAEVVTPEIPEVTVPPVEVPVPPVETPAVEPRPPLVMPPT
jgi:hypothetical protein